MAVEVEEYKKAISRFATGVAVIATAHRGRLAGMTANALFSLSLSPPSIVLSMQKDAESTMLIGESRKAAISFLSSGQRDVSELFAKRDSTAEKFSSGKHHLGGNGQPIIDGSISALEVDVSEMFPAADHLLLVCHVTGIAHFNDELPLIYWGSGYASESGSRSVRLPEPR